MKNIISFGHDCQIGRELERHGHTLNKAVSDIGTSSLAGLIHILETDFVDFFAPDSLFIIGKIGTQMAFQDTRNRMICGIPIKTMTPDEHPTVQIARYVTNKRKNFDELFHILKTENYVQILRSNINEESLEDIVRLRDLVFEFRNGLDFDMYVFQDTKFMNDNWGVPNLHTFQLQHWIWKDKWVGESDVWKKVFLMLNAHRDHRIKLI